MGHSQDVWIQKCDDLENENGRLKALLDQLTKKYQELVRFYDAQVGTPCEQIRHQQEVERLTAIIQSYEERFERILHTVEAVKE